MAGSGKTIAVVVPSILNCGGVASVAEFVIRAIRDRTDHDYRVISLAMAARDPSSLLITDPSTWMRGVTTHEGDFRGEAFTHVGAVAPEIEVRRFLPRARLVRELAGADLIQVVSGVPAWAHPVTGLGIPVSLQVATLIDVERRHKDTLHRGLVGAWRREMTRRVRRLDDIALRAVDAVQVENSWMLDHCRDAARSGSDVRFAAPGVDADLFRPADQSPALPGYIVSVGRMSDPRKRHMLLLEAYRLLCERMPAPPRLALAGPNGPTPEFEAKAREIGLWDQIDLHIFPSKPDLAALYRNASAFVLASDEEGFGVTVIEAMASGTPPVSTRSGGPDDIIADGKDGFLVDRDDAAALADRLFRVTNDAEVNASMRAEARRKVVERYSEDATARAFIEVFDTLLGISQGEAAA
ncbi:MAG: glycosyltransferase family 4 protein [Pseudomonadota bacterium]